MTPKVPKSYDWKSEKPLFPPYGCPPGPHLPILVILDGILVRLGIIFDMKFMTFCHLFGNYGCYFGASKYNVRMTTAMNALGCFEKLEYPLPL